MLLYLQPDFIVCVPLVSHSVSYRVDYVYLQKVGRDCIRVVKRLLFTGIFINILVVKNVRSMSGVTLFFKDI